MWKKICWQAAFIGRESRSEGAAPELEPEPDADAREDERMRHSWGRSGLAVCCGLGGGFCIGRGNGSAWDDASG